MASTYSSTTRTNYTSAVGFTAEVEKVLRRQEAAGQVLALPEAEARARYGDRLAIASLAALEKGVDGDGDVDVRVLHDGTNGVNVNRFIKVLDGGTSPTAQDLKATTRLQASTGLPHLGVTIDVEGAHRVYVVREEDWPLQACQVYPGGTVYLNNCGTFGIASAAYWWGRLAAAIHRAGLTILGPELPLWVLLFADDFNLTGSGATFARAILAFVWWLVILGVPISWKKSKGGLVYTWVGYEISLRDWKLGVSATRAEWVIGWLSRSMEARRVNTGDLREALGRMVFVYGALSYDKPFLAPLFVFLSLHPAGVERRLPLYARIVMKWLRDRLQERRMHPLHRRATIKDSVLRVDAKAEGMAVAVGGWAPRRDATGAIRVDKSPWFSVKLTEANAPWAFVRGVPARAIRTLELLATTLGLVLLAPAELDAPGAAGLVAVTGLTDSEVSSAVVTRGLTTAFPLCAVAMELSAQLEQRGAELFLEWVPRDSNREADRLADGCFEGFAEELRVQVTLEEVRWLVLGDLLRAGEAFYRAAKKQAGPGQKHARKVAPGSARPRAKLKEREPW